LRLQYFVPPELLELEELALEVLELDALDVLLDELLELEELELLELLELDEPNVLVAGSDFADSTPAAFTAATANDCVPNTFCTSTTVVSWVVVATNVPGSWYTRNEARSVSVVPSALVVGATHSITAVSAVATVDRSSSVNIFIMRLSTYSQQAAARACHVRTALWA
jgi:hypothetical protein